jgi:glyoxylase-like metal-dependent hydrolase (beta-lactamase superfamily II)
VIEPDRDLVGGVIVETDLGPWRVYETPGHAPSHVCLFQPERKLLLSGDHLLGRISLFYDYGWTADPVGEFLRSLDVVDALDARLCLSGHGRPFVDIHGHVEGNRRLIAARVGAVRATLDRTSLTAAEIVPGVFDEPLTEHNAAWRLQETLCYLRHLEVSGEVLVETGGTGKPERWRTAAPGHAEQH